MTDTDPTETTPPAPRGRGGDPLPPPPPPGTRPAAERFADFAASDPNAAEAIMASIERNIRYGVVSGGHIRLPRLARFQEITGYLLGTEPAPGT